jgi:alpha-1,3/alpha-1,6-mannosyltransferase
MAGGYDPRVAENVEHFQELSDLVRSLELEQHVTFLRSFRCQGNECNTNFSFGSYLNDTRFVFSDDEKLALLHGCDCLLYTPANEHFGIVPLEAM